MPITLAHGRIISTNSAHITFWRARLQNIRWGKTWYLFRVVLSRLQPNLGHFISFIRNPKPIKLILIFFCNSPALESFQSTFSLVSLLGVEYISTKSGCNWPFVTVCTLLPNVFIAYSVASIIASCFCQRIYYEHLYFIFDKFIN